MSIESGPKRHHFVPKMLQKQFTNHEGGLWTYNYRRPAKGVWCGKMDALLLQGHLYSHVREDGSKDIGLETCFSRLESKTAPIVEKIIKQAHNWKQPGLTNVERECWDFFFYQQFRRVPDLYDALLTPEQHKAQVEKFLDEFDRKVRTLTNKERSDFLDPATLARAYRNLRVSSLKTGSDNVLSVIAGRGLAVVRIPNPKKSFVLGSRPVLKLTPPETNDLSDPRVELWLAISPDVMVGVGPTDQRELIVDISDKNVRLTNESVCTQSSQIIGRSKELIASLSRFVGRQIGKSSLPEAWDESCFESLRL
jgi:hypothetical protein